MSVGRSSIRKNFCFSTDFGSLQNGNRHHEVVVPVLVLQPVNFLLVV